MLNRIVNGYTIIAQEHKPSEGWYLIMGMRRNHAGEFDYVTAWMRNPNLDTEWLWGHYSGSHFPGSIAGATENFVSRLGG